MTKQQGIEWLQDRTRFGECIHYLSVDESVRYNNFYNGESSTVTAYTACIQSTTNGSRSCFIGQDYTTIREAIEDVYKQWARA